MEQKVTTFRDRLLNELAEQGIRQVDLINRCKPLCEIYNTKLSSAGMSQYSTGKTVPDQLKLMILARALNVSEAWLMGYDVPKERREAKAILTNAADIRAWLEMASKDDLLTFIRVASEELAKK